MFGYRREIDGLRALAVVPVILFHAGFEAFSGGFVGVDVFFVISGYLITSIILTQKAAGTFSLLDFYERRARRILPALFLVMAFCIPFAWLWLMPSDMKDFSQSLVAVSVFASNILFWRESGYFDTAAELKPLLHTWSLAVEEQYYVLFPLFLIVMWRFAKQWTVATLAVIAALSFALAQWGAYNKPAATFLLLPTRGWEIAIGALLAFYFARHPKLKLQRSVQEIGSLIGLLLILYAVFAYSKATPFPSAYALAPTLGTALIILCAKPATLVGRVLTTKALVGIGLISYSAYLWHQPLFAFARYKAIDNPSLSVFGALCLVTVVLAYFSHRFVEVPFRDKNNFDRKLIFLIAPGVTLCFVALGALGIFMKGFEYRLDENQRQLLSFNSYNYKELYREGDCFLRDEQSYTDFKKICFSENHSQSILVWGDSHAAALSFGLSKTFENFSQFTASGCGPLLGVAFGWSSTCESINKFVSVEIESRKPKAVLLHANWLRYKDQNISVSLRSTINFIKSKSPTTEIFVLGGVPQYEPSLPTLMLNKRLSLVNDLRVISPSYKKVLLVDSLLKDISLDTHVRYFSSLDAFCSVSNCLVTSSVEGQIMPMAWDYGHLTSSGAIYLASKFKVFAEKLQ
jgi:peptidoglycan/LPS O-acetylase OafA/YrhL